jgi:hypothetical protein
MEIKFFPTQMKVNIWILEQSGNQVPLFKLGLSLTIMLVADYGYLGKSIHIFIWKGKGSKLFVI